MSEIKMHFKGGSGIKKPVDIDGNEILLGSILTRDYGDYEKNGLKVTEKHQSQPFYVVKINDKGVYYAESIEPYVSPVSESYFYLHDFRFKHAKVVSTSNGI